MGGKEQLGVLRVWFRYHEINPPETVPFLDENLSAIHQ